MRVITIIMDNKIFSAMLPTEKNRLLLALGGVGVAILYVILWYVFPLPFYSLFYASNIGSNILIMLLAAVVTFVFNLAFAKLTKRNIRPVIHLIINEIGMLAVVYTYSIFRYDAVYWVILAAAVHAAASGIFFVKSGFIYEQKRKTERKGTLSAVVYGVLCALVSDFTFLLLFTLLLRVFTG